MVYGPSLSPCLGSDFQNASDQNFNASEEPSKKVSDRSKNTLTNGMRFNRGLPVSFNQQLTSCHDKPL